MVFRARSGSCRIHQVDFLKQLDYLFLFYFLCEIIYVKEGTGLFNEALNTVYLQLYGIGRIV